MAWSAGFYELLPAAAAAARAAAAMNLCLKLQMNTFSQVLRRSVIITGARIIVTALSVLELHVVVELYSQIVIVLGW